MIDIRTEVSADVEAVRAVNVAAFGRTNEATLVDQLRGVESVISLVAVRSHQIVGHICFSPVTIAGDCPPTGLCFGLAPVAVSPDLQRQGIGTQLIQQGIEVCRQQGGIAIVVLGHPDYYPRFGFVPASQMGLRCEYDVPDESFMGLELQPGALQHCQGIVHYRPEFQVCE